MNLNRPGVKTRDLFQQTALSHPSDGPALIKLCLELFEHAETSQPSLPHRFLMDLLKSGQLVRTYTRNIDCLEEQAGLCIDVSKGPGVFISDPTSDTTAPLQPSLPRGVECVQLHGSIRLLRCIKCRQQCSWSQLRSSAAHGQLPTSSLSSLSYHKQKGPYTTARTSPTRHPPIQRARPAGPDDPRDNST